jgi:hypothetical protein
MTLRCPRCDRTLDFDGARPSFCASCGAPLPRDPSTAVAAGPSSPGLIEAATEPPARDPTTHPYRMDPDAAPALTLVGGYRLLRTLGAGGMGTGGGGRVAALRREGPLGLGPASASRPPQ